MKRFEAEIVVTLTVDAATREKAAADARRIVVAAMGGALGMEKNVKDVRIRGDVSTRRVQ